MIKRILLILFGTVSVLLLASCGDSNVFDCEAELVTPENELTLNGEEVLLKGGPLIGGILDIQAVDSFLVIKASTKESQDFLYVYSIGGGDFAGSFVTKGRGENELLSPGMRGVYHPEGNSSLFLYDLSLCRSYSLNLSGSISDGKTRLSEIGELPASTLEACVLSESLQLACYTRPDGIFGEVLDMSGHTKRSFAIYPELSGYNYFDKLSSPVNAFTGTSTVTFAMVMLPQVNFLDINTGKRHSCAVDRSYRDWEKTITLENGSQTIYYMDAVTSDKYLFALFYNTPFMDWAKGDFTASLHIFDIDGNFIRAAAFDEQIKAITYDTHTGILYGADQNDRIFRYDLSDLKLQ